MSAGLPFMVTKIMGLPLLTVNRPSSFHLGTGIVSLEQRRKIKMGGIKWMYDMTMPVQFSYNQDNSLPSADVVG